MLSQSIEIGSRLIFAHGHRLFHLILEYLRQLMRRDLRGHVLLVLRFRNDRRLMLVALFKLLSLALRHNLLSIQPLNDLVDDVLLRWHFWLAAFPVHKVILVIVEVLVL